VSLPRASAREAQTGLSYGRDFAPVATSSRESTSRNKAGRAVKLVAVTFQCSCGERFTVTDPIFDSRVSADMESVECLKCGGRS